jgi:hypothetical protein
VRLWGGVVTVVGGVVVVGRRTGLEEARCGTGVVGRGGGRVVEVVAAAVAVPAVAAVVVPAVAVVYW